MYHRYDASCGLDTLEGKFLSRLYYADRGLLACLRRVGDNPEYSGCPHDGMQHTLRFHVGHGRLFLRDVEAFLDLVEKQYVSTRLENEMRAFIAHVRMKIPELARQAEEVV